MKLRRAMGTGLISATLIMLSSGSLAEVYGPITISFDDGRATEVLAWSWGASQSGSFHVGGGAGAGKANFQDVSITRLTDELSPGLLRAVALGSYFEEVRLSRDDLEILLEPALITSYSAGGVDDKKEPQTENVSINFQRVTYSVGNGPPVCFDIAANQLCE